jgi:Rrf2 family protein
MLTIGTKGRYAARIMTYLALHIDKEVNKRKDIADSECISIDYVEQILIKLKAAGFVRSFRGARGGYALAVDPEKVTVADIVKVMEGNVELVPCLKSRCSRLDNCVTRPVWQKAAEAMMNVFSEFTIADMVKSANRTKDDGSLSYSI